MHQMAVIKLLLLNENVFFFLIPLYLHFKAHISCCRHSFEYSDRDETVTAHLVGGIDAFIKISLDWPLSSSGLKLISIKSSDKQSKSISLSFLCKVKVSNTCRR